MTQEFPEGFWFGVLIETLLVAAFGKNAIGVNLGLIVASWIFPVIPWLYMFSRWANRINS